MDPVFILSGVWQGFPSRSEWRWYLITSLGIDQVKNTAQSQLLSARVSLTSDCCPLQIHEPLLFIELQNNMFVRALETALIRHMIKISSKILFYPTITHLEKQG